MTDCPASASSTRNSLRGLAHFGQTSGSRCTVGLWKRTGWLSRIGQSPQVLLALVVLFSLVLGAPFTATAQPPGTRPATEAILGPPSNELAEPPVKGYMFLDEAGNPVMMPRMSFEEIDRLRNIEAGTDKPNQAFTFDSLEINGTVEESGCSLDIVLRISVDSTNGEWVSIPLRMGNFHLRGPADISGLDEHRMTVADDGPGHLLRVKTDQPRNVLVNMRAVARVSVAPTRSIDFSLPDVPSTVRISTSQSNVAAEIIGRGDEVVQTEPALGGRSRIIVESGGGKFSLKWGTATRSNDSSPVVEVESTMTVDWDSPQDLPLASVQMSIRNVRDTLVSFDIRLPPNAVLLDTPTIGSSTTMIEVSSPISEPEGDRIRILIPEEERQQRMDLSLDLQLSDSDTSAGSPLQLQVPKVIGALRQRGEVQVRTAPDYRLRWRSRPWVQAVLSTPADVSETSIYKNFRFDRANFTLPLWLSAKQRQLRLTSDTQISLLEELASLEMTIDATGQSSDGRGVQLDLAGWQLRSIVDMQTGLPLDSYAADQYIEIDLGARATEDPAPIRLRAERVLAADSANVSFSLPRVVKNDENLLVQSATLQIRSDGRRWLVIDLDRSTGLDPIADSSDSDLVEPTVSRFRILPPDVPARVEGVLVSQPPRITLATESRIELQGDQLITRADWTVSTVSSLEGRLPIVIPTLLSNSKGTSESNGTSDSLATKNSSVTTPPTDATSTTATTTNASTSNVSSGDVSSGDAAGNVSGSAMGSAVSPANGWTVTVDGAAATLLATENGMFDLVSDRLLEGAMSIRFRHIQTIARDQSGLQTPLVALPRPAVTDTSIVGSIKVQLIGDAAADLVAAKDTSSADGDEEPADLTELVLDSLPRETIRLRLEPRTLAMDSRDLTIRRAVLRSAIGRSSRHEQLLASVGGGDWLTIGLPADASEMTFEITVDGEPARIDRQEQALRVYVPQDKAEHIIDVRLWMEDSNSISLTEATPLMRLPAAIDRLYWQVIVPQDNHVVWASPTAGRAMAWEFEGWRISRESTHTDRTLNQWVGLDEPSRMPLGNRYLYVGTDVNSFQVVMLSRGFIWLITGSLVLLISSLLMYIPMLRHPISAVVGAVALAGLLVIAPDAAVMLGQLTIIAMVLVIIMFAIRSLITPRPSARVLTSSRPASRREPSTRTLVRPESREGAVISETQSMQVPGTPTEVSP